MWYRLTLQSVDASTTFKQIH